MALVLLMQGLNGSDYWQEGMVSQELMLQKAVETTWLLKMGWGWLLEELSSCSRTSNSTGQRGWFLLAHCSHTFKNGSSQPSVTTFALLS